MPVSCQLLLPLLFSACVVFGQLASLGVAQDAAPVTASPPLPVPAKSESLTLEAVEARIKQIDESTDLDESVRTKVVERYRQALAELKRASDLAASSAAFHQETATTEKRVQAVKSELEKLRSAPAEPPAGQRLLEELQQEQSQLAVELATLKQKLTDLDGEPKRRAGRRKDVRSLLVAAPERTAELKRLSEAAAPADEPQAIAMARQIELQARLTAMRQEIPTLEAELLKYDAEEAVDLVRLQRDLLTLQIERATQRLQLIDSQTREQKAKQDAIRVRQARLDKFGTDGSVRPYAERNLQLAEEGQELTQQIAQADAELKAVRSDLEEFRKQVKQTQKKVEDVGLTGAVGLALRRQRGLPIMRSLHQHRDNIAGRHATINDVHLKVFEYDDARTELANIDPILNKIVEAAELDQDAEQLQELRLAAEDVLRKQQEYLGAINRSYSSYFDILVELDSTERQLVKEAVQHRDYIDERVLWIRSGEPLSPSSVARDWRATAAVVDPAAWSRLLSALWDDLKHTLVSTASVVLLLMSLLYFGRQFRGELGEIGRQAERSSFTQFLPTIRATLLTFLIALPWPVLVFYVAWRLGSASDSAGLPAAVAAALWRVGAVCLYLEIVRHICRPHGLAESHFEWSAGSMGILRKSLRRLEILGLPLVFAVSLLHASDPEQSHDSFERICFILSLGVLTVFLWGTFRPNGPLMQEAVAYYRGGWFERLKTVILLTAIAGPLLFCLLSFLGYYYTADNLRLRMQETVVLISILWLGRGLLKRWLLMHRRRLAMQQARDRRAAAKEAAEREGEAPGQPIINVQASQDADLAAISTQTARLINVALGGCLLLGSWLIWIEVLPALNVLDRIKVGSTSVHAVDQKVLPDGTTEQVVFERQEAITIADVLLGLLIGLLTIAAARNVPGLLEISLLLRLPIDASVRYAITSLAQYAIVTFGSLMAFNAVGIGWSQVQWLVAAIGFGLGFGLQEIFANFISGLIILFERPVRVGDIVTIDGVSGVVSRIRIRATTIINWDRKELVVPNKEFITGRLLNWTLTDTVNRLMIEVGIAYGSDTRKARDLLLEIAAQHPVVLKDPAPNAAFEGFGDSSLKFVLRVFLPTMENRLEILHQLHTAVYDAFREAGIEIAFPQRDLHIRTIPEPLYRRMTHGSNGKHNGASLATAASSAGIDSQG